ncbi:MAG: aspartate racemase [Paracoccaceae bacterium]|jgi:aspartate racemase
MTALQTIGILGGMGPEATILLLSKLVEAVSAQDDSGHIPLLIDMNSQVPSRIAHLIEGTGKDPGPTLAAMARRLEVAGATALAMPCNTAHHYAGAITGVVNLPLLNMVDMAADLPVDTLGPGGSVGMLASPALQRAGLFEVAMEARGVSVIWPEQDDTMLAAIRAIKSHGPCTAARDAMLAASIEVAAAGADLQLIACSEFSIIADSVAPGTDVVDTIDLLTRAIVKFSQAS